MVRNVEQTLKRLKIRAICSRCRADEFCWSREKSLAACLSTSESQPCRTSPTLTTRNMVPASVCVSGVVSTVVMAKLDPFADESQILVQVTVLLACLGVDEQAVVRSYAMAALRRRSRSVGVSVVFLLVGLSLVERQFCLLSPLSLQQVGFNGDEALGAYCCAATAIRAGRMSSLAHISGYPVLSATFCESV